MEEWQPIATAPKDGSRIRVGHEMDPQSMQTESRFTTTAVYDDGRWTCNNAFVCIDMMLRWQPTHWLPTKLTEQSNG